MECCRVSATLTTCSFNRLWFSSFPPPILVSLLINVPTANSGGGCILCGAVAIVDDMLVWECILCGTVAMVDDMLV